MPLVDRRTDTVVLRIVYDGPPEAGKTTNVQQLCERISLNRRGELSSPGNRERTQFFDWLEVAGGYVQGRRIRCQLVSVPGQAELLRRRRYLLEAADAVVFVADARPSALELNQKLMGELQRILTKVGGERPARLVLQANKQDLPGAYAPQSLHQRLGLDAETCVLSAQACFGVGVLETLTVAVRLAVERVRALVLSGQGIDERETSEEPQDLLAALAAIEQSAIELIGQTPPLPRPREASEEVTPHPGVAHTTEVDEPSRAHEPAHSLPAGDAAGAIQSTAEVAASKDEPVANDEQKPPSAVVLQEASVSEPPCPLAAVTLPHADIPPGFVWPPLEGRVALREVAALPVVTCEDIPWLTPASLAFWCGDAWLIETTESDCFADVDTARHALLARIGCTLALGAKAPKDRVLTITQEPGHDGRVRLWTMTRAPHPLSTLLREDARQGARAVCDRTIRALEALHALAAQEQNKSIYAVAGVDGLVMQGDHIAYGGPLARAERPRDHEELVRSLSRCVSDACVEQSLREDVALELSASRARLVGPISASVDALVSGLSDELAAHSLAPKAPEVKELIPPLIPAFHASPSAASLIPTLQPSSTLQPIPLFAPIPTLRPYQPLAAIVEPDLELEVPAEDVPSGFVWPPVLGRAALAGFAEGRKVRALRPAPWAPCEAVELRSDSGLVAHTAPHWNFGDRESARTALSEQVRRQMWLSDFVPTQRAFAVGAHEGSFRMWVITPSLESARQHWDLDLETSDPDAATERLAAIVRTLIELADTPFETPVRPTLEHLAIQQGRVVYLGIPGEIEDDDEHVWRAQVAESFRALRAESEVVRACLPAALALVQKSARDKTQLFEVVKQVGS